MRKIILLLATIFIFKIVLSDVTETKLIRVTFPKFGTYESKTKECYKDLVKLDETESKMKGKGFWGSMIAKFFPQGKNANIYQLEKKMIYSLNYDESTYTRNSIENFFNNNEANNEYQVEAETEKQEKIEDDPYKIIRVDFDVIDTKETKKVNQFNTKHYKIIYLLEKEEIETGMRFIDSLFVDMFATSDKKLFTQANKEKLKFNSKMMELVGLEQDQEYYDNMLGLNWITMLSAMEQGKQQSEFQIDYSKLKKIKGHPVLIEGSYFTKEYDPNIVEKPESKPKKKKKLGGFGGFSSIMDKVTESIEGKNESESAGSSSEYKNVLSYDIETLELNLQKIPEKNFKVPNDFQEVFIKRD